MRAADYLQELSKSSMEKVARFFGHKSGHVKKMSADRLLSMLQTEYQPDAIERHFKKLTANEQETLKYLCLCTSARSEGAVRRDLKVSGGRTGRQSTTLNALISKGMIFVKKYYWEDILFVPDEVYTVILNLEMPRIAAKKKNFSKPYGEVRVTQHTGLAAHQDMLYILSTFAHEKVTITQQRKIYKRWMKKMDEKCRLKAESFASVMWSGNDYGNIEFWEQYLSDNGLIDRDHHYVHVQPQMLEVFTRVPYNEWARTYYDYYLDRLNRWKHVSRVVPLELCRIVFFGQGFIWTLKQTVNELINIWSAEWSILIEDQLINETFYRPLVLFGLIETGVDEKDREVWRWTDWGKAFVRMELDEEPDSETDLLTEDLYVQPNLEIMLPENILPAIRWRIETFAELKKSDAVLIYEWSASRLEQAIEAGWTLQGILEFIGRYSKNPLPDNVVRTITDWTENVGKVRLWDVLVFEVSDPSFASVIKRDKKISKMIVTSFSDTAHVIRRKDEEKLRAALKSLGYPALESVSSPDDPDERRKISKGSMTGELNRRSYAPDTYPKSFDKKLISLSQLTIGPADEY
ncbi:helicase-associated domain-containing protein [Sporolactobacillus sp. Y61]|uniref:Helicase-associated domain-containing protein n=1 Tax=Sporolactobacillus sp. Y61 TaxID=3160863 RepID=A0AAU8IIY2_9BACL